MLSLFDGDNGVADTFRHFEKQLGCGCWSWDLLADTMAWSRGYFELLGLEPDAVTPSFDAILQVTHPEDRPRQADIERVIREALSVRRKFRVIQPNGAIVWIFCQITVHVNAEGISVRAIGICTDITENQLDISQMRVADERYRALIKATDSLIWVAKPDGSLKESPNWNEFRSTPIETVLNDRWIELIHPDDRLRAITAFEDSVKAKADYSVDLRMRQPDGTHVWRRVRAVPVLGESREIKEWVGVNADVQQQKYALMPGKARPITGAQIRAARGLLKWSAEDLAEAAGTSRATIRRLEETDGPLPDRESSLPAIATALAEGGVEFIFPEIGKPGIRPR